MSLKTEVELDMTVRITGRDEATGEMVNKLNALFVAVEKLGGVIQVDPKDQTPTPTEDNSTNQQDTNLTPITDITIAADSAIYKDAPTASEIALNITPSNGNQKITVTDVSTNNALVSLAYDANTKKVTAVGQYAYRDASILVEWPNGKKQFDIPVKLYGEAV